MYDALLVVSFGGPERPADVMPFLENVTRGRNIPRERLEEVAEHYYHFGGKSPINEQNLALIAALKAELKEQGIEMPIYWGNRNWQPFLTDALRAMREDGVRNALSFCHVRHTAPIRDAGNTAKTSPPRRPRSAKGLRKSISFACFYNHPGFIEACAERIREALPQFAESEAPRLVATAHSIPSAMAETSNYEPQLRETTRLVAETLGVRRVGPGIPEPQRPADPALARARHPGTSTETFGRRRKKRSRFSAGFPVGPHGGSLRPRCGGGGAGQGTGDEDGPSEDGRYSSRLRPNDRPTDSRANISGRTQAGDWPVWS